jgi:MATE family multidrug resistance protein
LKSTNHLRETIQLSVPLIISQVGHIVTGLVDSVFLGQIGKTEQAAGFLANNVFVLLLVFSIGMSYGLTPLTTQAAVNNDNEEQASLLKNSFVLNLIISLLLFGVLYVASPLLYYMQQPMDVVDLAIPFFQVLIFSIIPCSVFFTGKQFGEGKNNTIIAMTISIAGNLINILLNYILIHGYLGFSEMGYMGSCWATFYARTFMGIAFLFVIYKSAPFNAESKLLSKVKVNLKDCIRLLKIGFGSALQFTFEVAAFVCCALMIGKFGKEQIDAHGIAIGIASFTYMFGSGISGASTILTGKYKAQSNFTDLKKSISTALFCIVFVTLFFAILFIALNKWLPTYFSTDFKIIELSSSLLIIAGLFQLFDGLQVTQLGILRGLEDVNIPTIITLIGYWVICLPLAYLLGIYFDLQAKGVWYAILIGLAFVAFFLLFRIKKVLAKLEKTKSPD